MSSILSVLVVASSLFLGAFASVPVARADETNLVDPGKVFLEDSEMPRGFKRLVDADTLTANPGLLIAIRQYSDGPSLIQQIVYSAATPEMAQQMGGAFLDSLPERFGDIEYDEILTLGDRAMSGFGENEEGVFIHLVAFQRSTIVGVITWIEKEGADLQADTTALATRMEVRARAALPKP